MVALLRYLASALRLLAVVSFGGLILPPETVPAQQPTIKDTIYTSPTWGYSIRWHHDDWIVDLDLSFEGADILGLRDDRQNTIIFTGEVGFNGDADACLDQMIADASGEEMAVAEDSLGEPYEYRDPEQSFIVYQAQFLDADGLPQDLVVYDECQTLIPGEAVFKRHYAGPPDVFAEDYDRIVDLLESVHLPRATAWLPQDDSDTRFIWAGESPLLGEPRDGPNLFPFPAEGTAFTLLIDLVDQQGSTRVITFENISDAPVTVEPANLALKLASAFGDAEPRYRFVSSSSWEDGLTAAADGSRTLAPGERATLHARIEPIDPSVMSCDVFPFFTFEYSDSTAQYTEFGTEYDVATCPEPASDPRPVMVAPLPEGVSRETLIPATAGQLDSLGRIPLARITLAPGAVTPDDLLTTPYTAVVESGSLDMAFGESEFIVSAGDQLSADSGPALVARNPTDAPATLLVLPLDARDDWGIPLEENPPPGLTFDLLFPEQNLTERQAPRVFSIVQLTLEPGAIIAPGSGDEPAPRSIALWVTRGEVAVTDPRDASGSQPVLANGGVHLPPGATIQAIGGEPADMLLVHVAEMSPNS